MFERAVQDLQASERGISATSPSALRIGIKWVSPGAGSSTTALFLHSASAPQPYIFNLFAEALHSIIERHIPAALRHYLDYFFLIFRPDSDPVLARHAVEWVMGLGRSLGHCFQDAKTVWPSTCVEFLGLELYSVAMEARLPADKLAQLLASWLPKDCASLREVQELVGFLQFCSQVIPRSRTYIRCLLDFSTKFKSPFQRLRIPNGARSDLRWWSLFCTTWNGVRIISPPMYALQVFTDASGTKGLGGIFGDRRWFSSRIPRRFRGEDIQFKEIYALLQAVLRWGDQWDSAHVQFNVDNQAVVS